MFEVLFDKVRHKIHDSQHGFFSKRSTQSNLLEFVTSVSKSMADGGQVDVLYTDFSKAFDRISHRRLLMKLIPFGFSVSLIRWFESYLSDRSQFVAIGGGRSHRITPTSGVPQGSILGPFLFLLYVNDLLVTLSNTFAFADDLKLLRKIVTGGDCYVFQLDIDRLHDWCKENKLGLNMKKCAVMSITRKAEKNKLLCQYKIGNDVVPRVNSKRDLGVIIDSKLSFAEHVSLTTRKAYQMLGFIFRCGKFFKNSDSIATLYNSLVRSRLEYCSTVWNPMYKKYVNVIERVQRKYTRMYYYKFNMSKPDYAERLDRLNMKSLEKRRLMSDEMTLYKIFHRRIDTKLNESIAFFNHGRSTRRNVASSRPIFYTTTYSSNAERNQPLNRMQDHHDKYFPECDIFIDSIVSFKNSVINAATNLVLD